MRRGVDLKGSLQHGIGLGFGVFGWPVSEILGHVYSAPVSDSTHSDHVVIGVQDVGAMRWRMHEIFMSGGQVLIEANILAFLV